MGTGKLSKGRERWFQRYLYVAMLSAVTIVFPLGSEAMMVTSNAIHRTFSLKWNGATGTGFTIDRESRQYLITARHVVSGIESGDTIHIYHDGTWKDLVVHVVGIGNGEVDVTVLSCPVRLSPSHPLIPTSIGIVVGQSISFLGFPFGWGTSEWGGGGEDINRGFPLPFIKAGIVSALGLGGVSRIYLDAHGNQGFSGGPVVFYPGEQRQGNIHVAGIISFYPVPQLLPLVDREGKPFTNSDGNPVGYVKENPGIVVAIDIKHAAELIDANPIGFQLPAAEDAER